MPESPICCHLPRVAAPRWLTSAKRAAESHNPGDGTRERALPETVCWHFSGLAGRAHFFAVAAQQMRRLLIDYARAREADKRGRRRTRSHLSKLMVCLQPGNCGATVLDRRVRGAKDGSFKRAHRRN